MEDAYMEIEALRSIFEEELVVEEKESFILVTKKVRPTDDENSASASVICQFTLLEGYPNKSPEVELSRPRGLSDTDFMTLKEDVKNWLIENQGVPTIFDILQLCGDFFLTHQNSSELLCPICLCPLSSSASISTPCDHYLHKSCMDMHTLESRKGIAAELQSPEIRALHKEVDRALYCPVCRELVENEIEPLYEGKKKGKQRKEEGHKDFEFDWNKWRREQQRLNEIYEKQLQNGGIIDLEKERQKHVITEDTVVEIPPPVDVTTIEEPTPSDSIDTTEKGPKRHKRNYNRYTKDRRYHHNIPKYSKRESQKECHTPANLEGESSHDRNEHNI